MLTVMGEDTAKFEGKMRAITELLKFLGVDETIMDSINHYYEYKFANKCMFDEQVPACFRPCFYDRKRLLSSVFSIV